MWSQLDLCPLRAPEILTMANMVAVLDMKSRRTRAQGTCFWVAVRELTLSYHNPETIVFAVYPYITVT